MRNRLVANICATNRLRKFIFRELKKILHFSYQTKNRAVYTVGKSFTNNINGTAGILIE